MGDRSHISRTDFSRALKMVVPPRLANIFLYVQDGPLAHIVKHLSRWFPIFINREAREIIELVASVCLSVRLYVSVCSHGWTVRLLTLQRAKKSHNQSKDFVCVSNNCMDAVDPLLIPVPRLLSLWTCTKICACPKWLSKNKHTPCYSSTSSRQDYK